MTWGNSDFAPSIFPSLRLPFPRSSFTKGHVVSKCQQQARNRIWRRQKECHRRSQRSGNNRSLLKRRTAGKTDRPQRAKRAGTNSHSPPYPNDATNNVHFFVGNVKCGKGRVGRHDAKRSSSLAPDASYHAKLNHLLNIGL